MKPIAAIALAVLAAGCGVNSSLERLTQARSLSADLLVQFTRASDAANKAVMATTDEASIAFAREADAAKLAIQTDSEAIQPILSALQYAEELRLVQEFVSHFAEYRTLDRRILDLAVENTNLKAQSLSFGPAAEAADTLTDSLETVAPLNAPKEMWRVKALAATASAAVRHIQALQAPHIASAEDAEMNRIEARMTASAAVARSAVEALAPLVQPASRPKVMAATAALDRFMAANAQIVALSRRNTNVRSLALSLNEKGKLTQACEESLTALRDALSRRDLSGAR